MQEPFDVLGLPPAELPQGSSHLPDFNNLPAAQTYVPASYITPPADFEAEIAQLDPQTQVAVRAWWPRIWGRPSEYTGYSILTIYGLLQHIEAAEKAERATGQIKNNLENAHGKAVSDWQAECRARNAWIEQKCAEWKSRVAQRKKAVVEWDSYVEQARLDYYSAKATTPPPRPVKS